MGEIAHIPNKPVQRYGLVARVALPNRPIAPEERPERSILRLHHGQQPLSVLFLYHTPFALYFAVPETRLRLRSVTLGMCDKSRILRGSHAAHMPRKLA